VLETPATETDPILSINPEASTVNTGTWEADPYVPDVTVVLADLSKSAVTRLAVILPVIWAESPLSDP